MHVEGNLQPQLPVLSVKPYFPATERRIKSDCKLGIVLVWLGGKSSHLQLVSRQSARDEESPGSITRSGAGLQAEDRRSVQCC